MPPSLSQHLSHLLGPDRVSTTADDIAVHATDKWFAANDPDVVVFAHTTDDVSKLLSYCNEHKVPLTPRGAGVGYVGGCVPAHGGVALSLAKMDAIVEVNPLDGVAVVEPGVITGHLQQAARDKGWFYPPDPASLKECSIGGNIATNAGGPRCLKYGVTRHYVLGLEAVLADGTVLKAGGRTHKNKTGFDLVGNFVGSEGMLGVVTQATLRLIPEPPARAMLSAGFATFPEAANAVQKVLGAGYLPSALEITDKFTLQAARDHLGNNSAALVPDGQAHLLIEIDGQTDSVNSESNALFKLLDELGAVSVEVASTPDDCAHLWELRREFSYSLRATGLTKLNEDVTVPRSRLVDLVEFGESLQESSGFPVACFGHAGDGNIHVNIMVPDPEDEAQKQRADQALDKLFHQVIAWGGAITGEHGIGIAKRPWFQDALHPGAHHTHHLLKKAYDPNHILNPGKFIN